VFASCDSTLVTLFIISNPLFTLTVRYSIFENHQYLSISELNDTRLRYIVLFSQTSLTVVVVS